VKSEMSELRDSVEAGGKMSVRSGRLRGHEDASGRQSVQESALLVRRRSEEGTFDRGPACIIFQFSHYALRTNYNKQ